METRLLSRVPSAGLWVCGCGASYPEIDGIPLILRDLAGWMRSEAVEVLARADLPAPLTSLLAASEGGAWARNRDLVAVYARSTEGPLQDWLRETGAKLTGDVLELGSGLGVLGRADVTALDGNLGLLRHHPGRTVCADAADPPFLGASFDAVAVANVLDSCNDPGVVLAQAAGLLRPGGRLIVSCAFAFQESITPRSFWFDEPMLRGALSGAGFFGRPIRVRLDEALELDWPLRVSARTTHTHRTAVYVATRLDSAG